MLLETNSVIMGRGFQLYFKSYSDGDSGALSSDNWRNRRSFSKTRSLLGKDKLLVLGEASGWWARRETFLCVKGSILVYYRSSIPVYPAVPQRRRAPELWRKNLGWRGTSVPTANTFPFSQSSLEPFSLIFLFPFSHVLSLSFLLSRATSLPRLHHDPCITHLPLPTRSEIRRNNPYELTPSRRWQIFEAGPAKWKGRARHTTVWAVVFHPKTSAALLLWTFDLQ